MALFRLCPIVLVATFTFSAAFIFRTKEEFRQTQFNIEDLQYYSISHLGKQSLHAVMDTGSMELVVISDRCSQWCGDQKKMYRPEKSKSYKTGRLSQVLSYGSGDLVGKEAYDSFAIGPFKSPEQPFWEIVQANMPLLEHSDFAVIVGLGPIDPKTPVMKADGGDTNEQAYAGMLENLKISRYGFCLKPEPGAPGYLIWNDESIYRHADLFFKVKMIDSGYWMASLRDVTLGDRYIACSKGCGAIVDSGTSLLALPSGHYGKLQQAIWDLGPNCNDISNLPNLHFKLDGVDFHLPADAYLGEVEGAVPSDLLRHFKKAGGHAKASCQEALMHVSMESTEGPTWIFGMPFFRSFYTVFEQGTPGTMYVARSDRNCKPTSSKSMELYPARSPNAARKINVTKVRFSPGVRRAISLGHVKRVVRNVSTTQPTLSSKTQPTVSSKTQPTLANKTEPITSNTTA